MSYKGRGINKGLSDYVQEKREETLRRIDEAIKYLRSKNLLVTKKSITDELGIHYNTTKKKYIQLHLLEYPEFNPALQVPVEPSHDQLNEQIVLLQWALKKAKQANKNLLIENSKLRLKNKEIDDKYQRLLGRYQVDVGKKIVPF